MKTKILYPLLISISFALNAETYYLQHDMSSKKDRNSILSREIWNSDPSGSGLSSTQMTGNTFVINGYKWRTPNTNRTSNFPGTLAVSSKGAATGELMSSVWQPFALLVESKAVMRLRRPSITLRPQSIIISKNGEIVFVAHKDGSNSLILEVGTLVGEGRILFGRYASTDKIANWSLSVNNSNDFTGEIDLNFGKLLVEKPLNLSAANLNIERQGGALLSVKGTNLVLAQLTIDGQAITPGNYVANELGKEFKLADGTPCINGAGQISILE